MGQKNNVWNHYFRDKKRLVSELNKSEFRKVDLETLEVISVALDAPQIWNKREKYIQIEGEKEKR